MHFRKRGLISCAVMTASLSFMLGAQQVELGLVSTSVGVKPTSQKNKFKLETDPAFTAAEVGNSPTPADYIPVEGYLDNHFDTSQFTLATDPITGNFSLGGTAAGETAYQVVGFEVQTVDGGLIDVQDNGEGGENVTNDTSAPLDPSEGPVGGGYTGNVYDIHFKIISQDRALAMPSNVDQNFYELFLNQIGNDPPGLDTTFVDPTSSVTFAPIDPNSGLVPFTVTSAFITPSSTPEVSSAGFLAVGGLTLLLRRRRAKRLSTAQALIQSPPPPIQA